MSPAEVCEADEVSSSTGIRLGTAAAGPLRWYDLNELCTLATLSASPDSALLNVLNDGWKYRLSSSRVCVFVASHNPDTGRGLQALKTIKVIYKNINAFDRLKCSFWSL